MGTTRTLADGEAFVQGRSQATAAKLVQAAADADLKGSVFTTYDGYIAPVEVVEAAGFAGSTESSTPENPADHSDPAPVKTAAEAVPADADEAEDENPEGLEFDPSAATVDEVKEYLDGADDTERERVLAAEAEGKGRKSVLGLATIPEGAK